MVFPLIINKQDFIKKIEHKEEIGILDKGLFTVIQYNVNFPTTFDIPEALECRGIVFCNKTGNVLRRPFEKFFNINEKEHTQFELIKDETIVRVTEKLDGTMIAPFLVNDEIYWGTKRCAEDFNDHIKQSGIITEELEIFVRGMIQNNKTPIFEFHDPQYTGSVIVIKYDKPFLTLLAIRDNETGEYENIESHTKHEPIKLVAISLQTMTNLKTMIDFVETLEGEEGFVIELETGMRVKLKTPWYVKRHKIKELFNYPHISAQLVLDCYADASLDDILPYIDELDREYFENFSEELHTQIDTVVEWACMTVPKFKDKKELGLSKTSSSPFSSILFSIFDNPTQANAFKAVVDNLKKNLGKQIRLQEWAEKVDRIAQKEIIGE